MSTDKKYFLFFIVLIIPLAIFVLLQNKDFVLFCKKVVKEPICIKKIPEVLEPSSTSLINLSSSPSVVPVEEKCMLLHADVPCLGVKPDALMPKMSCGEMNDSAVKLNYDT